VTTGRSIPSLPIVMLVLALMIAGTSVATAAENEQVTWGEPVILTSTESRAWFPEIDAGVDGTVRVVWEQGLDRPDLTLSDAGGAGVMMSTFEGAGWSASTDIYVKDPYNAGRPIVASDERYLYLLGRSFRSESDTYDQIMRLGGVYFTRAPLTQGVTNAQSWNQPVQISRSSAYWASIAVLPRGNLVVIYNEVVEYPASSGLKAQTILMSRHSSDYGATWGHPVRVSIPGSPAVRSSIASTGGDASVVACWDEGYDNLTGARGRRALYTAVSEDGGRSWSHVARVEANDPPSSRVSFSARGRTEQCAVASNGETTLLVYRSTMRNVLLYRTSTDGGLTWSEEELVPEATARPFLGEHHFDKLGLAVDADGRFLLSYVGQAGSSASGLAVMMSSFHDGQWSRPQVVAEHDGYPEYPRIAVANGNEVAMTYFVRDEQFGEESAITLWVVTGESPAASLPPGALVDADVAVGQASAEEPLASPVVSAQVEIFQAPDVPGQPPPISLDPADVVAPRAAVSEPIYAGLMSTAMILAVCFAVIVTFRAVMRARI
jgi:hypothetical protein